MKYFKYRLFHLFVFVCLILFYSLLIWFVGKDDFDLTYGKSIALTVIVFLLWDINKQIDESERMTNRLITSHKRADAIAALVEKNLAEKTPKGKRLEEYRRTFGQSEKK